MKGDSFSFEMTNTPNLNLGKSDEAKPYSMSKSPR